MIRKKQTHKAMSSFVCAPLEKAESSVLAYLSESLLSQNGLSSGQMHQMFGELFILLTVHKTRSFPETDSSLLEPATSAFNRQPQSMPDSQLTSLRTMFAYCFKQQFLLLSNFNYCLAKSYPNFSYKERSPTPTPEWTSELWPVLPQNA